MTDRDRFNARVEALSDQRWMEWAERAADLERIACNGPADERDEELARRALLFFAGEVARRAYKRIAEG